MEAPLPNRDLIVIGASAGGIEALRELCAGLPSDLNAAVLIVMHISPYSNGLLPRLLSRVTRLTAGHPADGEPIQKGRIYIAPPDFHMIVDSGRLRIVRGPRENHSRPAIDPTFRSAAMAYGRRVIGVVLTGMLDDGTAGLMVIKARGGDAVIQDPRTAMFPSMPTSALERVPDAHVVPLDEMAKLLKSLLAEQLDGEEVPSLSSRSQEEAEVRLSEMDMSQLENESHPGKPSEFACPECGGVLWEIEENGLLRFRCRVGHAYTARHLRAEQRHAIETALWAALRALEESVSLYKRMAQRAVESKHEHARRTFEERAATAEQNVRTLREFLLNVGPAEKETDEASEAA